MKDISDELQAAFKSNIRELYAEAIINFSDVTLDPSASASSLEAIVPDLTSQIILGNTVPNCKWASMDGISDMSGEYCMQPSDTDDKVHQVGFWSDELTDIDGLIDTTLTITSVERRISNIKIYGDSRRQEYPVDLTLVFSSDSAVLSTEYITGNTEVIIDYDLVTELADCSRIDITVTKYSTAGTNVKVVAVLTALTKTFTSSDIIGFSATEESEISNSNTIPTGNVSYSKLNLELANKDRQFDVNNISSPLYGAIKPNSKVDIKLGARTSSGIELFSFFSGWTGGFTAPENGQNVTTTAYDRVQRLELTEMSPQEVQIDQTVGDLLELILNDAGLSSEFIDIDAAFYDTNYVIPIYFIQGSDHLTELKRLSEAVTASVYSSSDVIVIESVESFAQKIDTQETYTRSDYVDKVNTPLYDTLINTMNVNYTPYALGDLETQYETSTEAPDTIEASGDTELTFNFSDSICIDHALTFTPPTGVSIVSEDYYSDRAVITFNNTNATSKDLTILIEAKAYKKANTKTYSITDVDSENEYGERVLSYPDNDLIQTLGLANTLGDYLLGAYKDPFRDVTVQLTNAGNPALCLTDRIAIVDRYESKRYNIVSKNTSYDGGLSMVLKGRVASLKDYNLIDNEGNLIVDNNGDQIVVLNTDIEETLDIIDNNLNNIIDNQGRTLVARSN